MDLLNQRPRALEARDNSERFLWGCGRATLTAPQILALKAAGERLPPAEWEQVALLAESHRMGSLVFKHATQADLLSVMPETVREKLKLAYCSAIVVNRTLQIELDRILSTFAARQIEAIPLKGVLLAARYYPQLALRPASDIDLLMRPSQIAEGMQALAALGYVPRSGSESLTGTHALRFFELQFSKPQGPTIEVHTMLTRAPSYRKSLSLPEAWSRAYVHQIGDRSFRCLAVQDELRYLCLHYAVQHHDARWFWLVDIVQIVDSLPATWSWRVFVHETTECGLATPVVKTFQDAVNSFGLGVPQYVLDNLWAATASPRERTAWKQAHATFATPAHASRHLLMLQGTRAKLEFAREMLRFGSHTILHMLARAK